jgi:hypothetical protein
VSDAGMEVRLTVADLQADPAAMAGWDLWFGFEYRGQRFDVLLQPTSTTVDRPAEVDRVLFGDLDAYLLRVSDDAFLGTVPSGFDATSRAFNATVPWTSILEPGGNSPVPGEPLRIVEAGAEWSPLVFGTRHNPMPTGGVEALVTGDLAAWPDGTFLAVPGAVGDLSLSTAMPVRFSNGEATTLHWPVEVANQGNRTLQVALDFDVAGAEGRAPPGIHLGPGERKVFNVYVTLPFNHEHGTTRSFLLRADSRQGDVTTLRLGVDYPAIAQPAGHHPTLFLHARQEHLLGAVPFIGWQWMNTAEDDDRSNAPMAGARFADCPGGGGQGEPPAWGNLWTFGLNPGLRMGLDGRVGEMAVLEARIVGTGAVPSGTLYGRLALASASDGSMEWFEDAALIGATALAPGPGPADVPVRLEIPLPPELDYVPPAIGEDLLLGVLLCLDAAPAAGTAVATAMSFASIPGVKPYGLATGGRLTLPLDEYHDFIDTGGSASGLVLEARDAIRRGAPGASLLWTPTLTFPEGDTGRYAVRLFGTGAPHARLLAADIVAAGEPVKLPLSFTVPDVPAGQVFDLLVDVTHLEDPGRAVALRLSLVVDPAATQDDANALASFDAASKGAPGSGLPLLALALAGLVFARRKRQRDGKE